MLTLTDLSLNFQSYAGIFRQVETTRLSRLNLTVAPGELTVIVGASGAGKSLLAHAILGLLPPNALLSGEMTFKGKSLLGTYPQELRGRHIALMPQDIGHLDPLATIGAQIRWAGRRAGASQVNPAERLADVGLSQKVAEYYPRALSVGMARRVLMALSLSGIPDLLIADEPTAGLDPANRDRVLQLLREQARNDRAALLITHDLTSVLPLADRVVILDDGMLQSIEQAQSFTEDGHNLQSRHARALWRALPENGFCADA